MNADDLRARFAGLRVWKSRGRRAPHKPLLALWAIGRCLRDEPRMAPFPVVQRELRSLLERFGPPRKAIHPEFPFQYLETDGLWEIRASGPVARGSGGHLLVSSLRRRKAAGGFPEEVFEAFRSARELALEIADMLVHAHFPASRHMAVLEAAGIEAGFGMEVARMAADRTETAHPDTHRYAYVRRRIRSPRFSREVLAAYGHRCAVCAFAVRLADDPVALEGAHIRWHCAEGPDEVRNGLALCALHHSLFDAGAFTLDAERRVDVADRIGGRGFADTLERYARREAMLPASVDEQPAERFLAWHRREVFVYRQ